MAIRKNNSALYSRLTNNKYKKPNAKDPIVQNLQRKSPGSNPLSITIDLSDVVKMTEGKYDGFERYDTQQLKKAIENFEKVDVKNTINSKINELLFEVIPENIVHTTELNKGVFLYRARSWQYSNGDNSPVFETIDDVWYAKPEYLKKMGRFNQIGQPMLYTSLDAMTPIHEIRNKPNEHFALIKYKLKPNQRLKLATIAVEDTETIANRMRDYYNWTEKAKTNWQIINGFLTSIITKKVMNGEEDWYKVTNAVLRFFDFPECDGYIYPSVERGAGYNIVIKPESVDKALEFEGLAYWLNKGYDNVKIKSNDFFVWQKWSTKVKDRQLIYSPIGACPIEFVGIGEGKANPSRTYYRLK